MNPRRNNGDRSLQGEINTTGRFRFQRGVRTLIVLVGCGGILGWILHAVWDQNRPAKVALRVLASSGPSERADAIRELERLGLGDSEIVIPPLITALKDRDAKVRTAAAVTLGTIGCDAVETGSDGNRVRAAITALLGALKDPEPAVRNSATVALGYLTGSNGASRLIDLKAVISSLVAKLSDGDGEIRLATFHVLAALGRPSGAEAPAELAAALKDESPANRAAAVAAVASFARGLDPMIPSLIRMMENDDAPSVRTACALAIERVRPPAISLAAAPALIAALGRPDPRVRAVASSALMQLGPDARAAIPALIAVAREKPGDPANPEHGLWGPDRRAIEALGRIAPATEREGEAVAALVEVLRAPDASKWNSAIYALEPFGAAAAPAIPALIHLLRQSVTSQSPFVNGASVARALGRIAPGTESAVAAVAALNDLLRADQHRSAAAQALGEFGPAAASAIPDLIRILRTTADTDRDLEAGHAAFCLGRVAPGTPSSAEAIAALAKALQVTSWETRSQAIYALYAFGPKAATSIPRLRELSEDPNLVVRSAAQSTLARLSRASE